MRRRGGVADLAHGAPATADTVHLWFSRWRRGTGRTNAAFWEHLGGGGGFWSMMRIYPGQRIGVVTMGNVTGYDHDSVAEAVAGA